MGLRSDPKGYIQGVGEGKGLCFNCSIYKEASACTFIRERQVISKLPPCVEGIEERQRTDPPLQGLYPPRLQSNAEHLGATVAIREPVAEARR